ncbi:MAG: hypothetical protein ACRC5C_15530 [Bacilli bacterium]
MSSSSMLFKRLRTPVGSGEYTIVIYPDWGSAMSDLVHLINDFLSLGFHVAVAERWHAMPSYHLEPRPHAHYWQTVFTAVDEHDGLMKQAGLCREETILFGIGMGGAIASSLFFRNYGYAGLISASATSSFVYTEAKHREQAQLKSIQVSEVDLFKRYDPRLSHIRTNSPVLFLHTEDNSMISFAGQRDFYYHLLVKGTCEQVEFYVEEGSAHGLTQSMQTEVREWVIHYFHHRPSLI